MTSRDTDKYPTLIPVAALLATFLLVALASFLPSARLWGVNHLAYFPLPLRLLLLAAIAVSFIPWVGTKIMYAIERVLEAVRARRRLSVLVCAVVPVLSFLFFLSMQSSTRVLGDGQVVANNLQVPYRGDSTQVAPTLKAISHNDHIAPGTTMLFYLASVAYLRMGGHDPVEAPQIVSCLLGSILVLLLLAIALRRRVPVATALWMLVLVCSSGAMELFFGYVENYALLVVLGALYATLGFRMIGGTGSWWVAVLAVIAATFAHVSGVLLVPSLLMLLWYAGTGKKNARSVKVVTLALLAATVVAVIVVARTPVGARFFVPLRGTEDAYGFFSPARWADLANELLLLMPQLLVVAATAVVLALRRSTVPDTRSDRPFWYFATLLAVPQFMYLIFFNPEIGMGRDWDLFTPAAVGLVVFGVLIFQGSDAAFSRNNRLLVVPSLVMGLVMGTAWVGINASYARSTERFEHILDYTKSRRDYAYEVLSKTYYDHGMLADAIRAMEKASTESQNPRHYLTLSLYYREYGDIAAAKELLRRTLVRRPGYLPARQEYVSVLFAMRDYEGAMEAARAGLELYPRDAFFHLSIGKSLMRLNRPDEAREILRQGRALATDEGIKHEIDQELQRLATN